MAVWSPHRTFVVVGCSDGGDTGESNTGNGHDGEYTPLLGCRKADVVVRLVVDDEHPVES